MPARDGPLGCISGRLQQVGHQPEGAGNQPIELMVQNEVVILLVDGAIRASVPDVITMLHSHDASPATIEDLWVGNMIDIVVMHADAAWYTPEGIGLAGPKAFGVLGAEA